MKNYLIILCCFLSYSLFSQSDQTATDTTGIGISMVQTDDGSEFIGRILEENRDHIILMSDVLGVIYIPQMNVTWVRNFKTKQGRIVTKGEKSTNAHYTHYFFGQSGYGLETRERYYRTFSLAQHEYGLGLAKNFSVGVSTLPALLFASRLPVWISPKLSLPIQQDRIHLAAGAHVGSVIGGQDFFSFLYVAPTFGTRERNFSIGITYSTTPLEEIEDVEKAQWSGRPLLTFSTMYQIKKTSCSSLKTTSTVQISHSKR
ncbi:MAG: hypothetical protein AAGI23_16340 [Bacteroidota bacterium]